MTVIMTYFLNLGVTLLLVNPTLLRDFKSPVVGGFEGWEL